MKSKPKSLALKWVVAVYGIIYFLGFAVPIFSSDIETLKTQMSIVEIYTVPAAFAIFLLGTIISWLDEIMGGTIILVWHFIVWILATMFWKEAGMVLILIFPMLIIAVFLILNGYKANDKSFSDEIKQRQLALKIFLINYAAIYFVIVFSEVISKLFGVEVRGDSTTTDGWNFNFQETVILIFEIVLFAAACLFTLRSKLLAGISLIVWYIIIFIAGRLSHEIGNSGPWAVFSFPILIQGILYLELHRKEKEMIPQGG